MRILVSCPQCKRRYKAEERKVGAKFRCHCGNVLEVRQPPARDHAAGVVRCSSCGGAREKNARRCGFCGADFTLHERDLNAVCPTCFARASTRARYCTQCGERLSGESIATRKSKFVCPACPNEERLASRVLGKERISVLECQYCTGLWVGADAFQELRDRVMAGSARVVDSMLHRPKPKQLRDQAGPRYRKCVICGKLMARRQYAQRSGVVIDVCRNHGIWFDPDELHQVLQWIAEGGHGQRPPASLFEKPQAEVTSDPVGGYRRRRWRRPSGGDFLDDILRELFLG